MVALAGSTIGLLIKIGLGLPFFISLGTLAAVGAATLLLYTAVKKTRQDLTQKAAERVGHQGEPGSWRCSCGRYNTYYRSVCLGCGKPKPGTMSF